MVNPRAVSMPRLFPVKFPVTPSSALSLCMIAAFLVFALSSVVAAQNITLAPIITTVAQLGNPYGVRADNAGNIYVAEAYSIVKIDPSGTMTTVAGNGTAGFSGDNGPAVNAQLDTTAAVSVDGAGNLYIADYGNSRIRKVTASTGIITTVAGSPGCTNPEVQCYGGDGGPATSAKLDFPTDVIVDGAGDLYIADRGNDRVRKVDTAGVISTIAGNGSAGNRGDGGPATSASLNIPWSLAFDGAGNLYIADSLNNRIRKVDTRGIITTVVGNANLNSPRGVAIGRTGDIYISDQDNNRILKVDTAATITTVAGTGTAGFSGDGGPAALGELATPQGITLDSVGNLYIADFNNRRIRKVSIAPSVIDFGQVVIRSNSTQTAYLAVHASLTLSSVQASGDFLVLSNTCSTPAALPAGAICTLQVQFAPSVAGSISSLLVATDSGGKTYNFGLHGTGIGPALAFTPGIITTIAGNGSPGCTNTNLPLCYGGDGGIATSALFHHPYGLALDSGGNVFLSDELNFRIREVGTNGNVDTFAGIFDLACLISSNPPATCSSGDGGPAASAQFHYPYGLSFDGGGNLYIAELGQRIRKVDVGGTVTTIAGNGTAGFGGDGGPATSAQMNNPVGVAADTAGNIYFTDQSNNRVRKVDTGGNITTVAGDGNYGYTGDGGQATGTGLYYPTGVAADAVGNIYIADQYDQRIRKVTPAGIISTVAGDGTIGYGGDGGPAVNAQLNYPWDVALDTAGNLYITDYGNSSVRKVDVNGTITTVAGNGSAGFSGDGGPATSAQMFFPSVVAVDGQGDLYIADTLNNRVRKVDGTTASLSFGTLTVGQTSAPQSVQITNIGNSLLSFISIAFPSNFQPASVGNDCVAGTPLAPGATCKLGVVFAPQVAGSPLLGTLVVFSNATGFHSVSLSGTALAPPPVTITITSNPLGPVATVTGSGCQAGSYSTPATLQWTPFSACAVSFTSPQSVVARTQDVFTGWADNVSANPRGITAPSAATTYTANFKTRYQLITAVNPAGAGTVTGAGFYDAGTQAAATATANSGYVFNSWNGPVTVASTAATKVTMTAPVTVTANFTPVPVVAPILSSRIGPTNARVWSVAVPNTGKAVANNTMLNSFGLTQTAGTACTPVVVTAFPIALGNIAPGGSATANVTIDFTGCSAAARFTLKFTYSSNGGAVKGTVIRYNLYQ